MLKKELEQGLHECAGDLSNAQSEIHRLKFEIEILNEVNKVANKTAAARLNSILVVRKAIETIVATHYPGVGLNVTAYELTMGSQASHPAQKCEQSDPEWGSVSVAPKPECQELSLLRHLHSLAR